MAGALFKLQKLDVRPFLEAGRLPEVVVSAPAAGRWAVRQIPMFTAPTAGQLEWTRVAGDAQLRIPLLPYEVGVTPEDVAAAVSELSLRAVMEWPGIGGGVVMLGHPILDKRPHVERFQLWFGIAVLVRGG